MAEIDRYRAEDRRVVDALYRRVFGHDAAEASRLRWDWQYLRNPNNPRGEPEIWIAREGPAIVGQYATMPVQVTVAGRQVRGSWGMDVMVAPERQRQGLGEVLFRTWDRNVGASLGLGLSESSYRLFNKLRWPDVGPLPCLVKPLTRRALRIPTWPVGVNRLVSAVTLPIVKIVARTRPLGAEVRLIQRFDDSFTELWESLAPKFDFAVRRDAAYLNWKFVSAPHIRYVIAALRRDDRNVGLCRLPALRRAARPGDGAGRFSRRSRRQRGLGTLLGWVDREARQADSDKIRTFAMHAGFRRVLKRAGYFQVKSTVQFVVKVNGIDVAPSFYEDTDRWHVTLGDSDQDR